MTCHACLRFKKLNLNCRDYDVVINCTGLAAAKLSNDPKMAPVRGHVIKVSAPWIKVAVCADNDTYVIPGNEHTWPGDVI